MGLSLRNNAITAVALFLEGCTLYLAFVVVSTLVQLPQAPLHFWLVLLALLWAFLLSSYLLSASLNPHLRGLLGLVIGVPSILLLADFNSGTGLVPLETLTSGDLQATAGLIGAMVFLVVVWWRGVSVAREEVTLESVREAFLWGLGALVIASLVDSLNSADVVNGFFVVGFFAVGLAGLSLARFASEGGEAQALSLDWFVPIAASVGSVLVLGLLISAAGLGGLDDVTRDIFRSVGTAGFWILRPILLFVGLIAGGLVELGNWLSGQFGGGDLTALLEAQGRLEEFHAGLREEAAGSEGPSGLITAAKWLAFVAGASVFTYVVYRLFRSRRLQRSIRDVEETRESLFSWKKAGDDMSDFLSDWWNGLFKVVGGKPKAVGEPGDPREFYHGLLAMAERVGQPRREWETPKEHQHRLVGLLPADPVARIVDRFQSSHYGHTALQPQELETLNRDWKTLGNFLREREKDA